IDAVDAELDRAPRILDRGNAFEDQGNIEFRLVALDVAPILPRLEDAAVADPDPRALVPLGDVALAPAVMVGVDGQAKGIVAGVDRTAEVVVDPVRAAADIELKDLEAAARSLGGRFETGMRHRAQDHAIAE